MTYSLVPQKFYKYALKMLEICFKNALKMTCMHYLLYPLYLILKLYSVVLKLSYVEILLSSQQNLVLKLEYQENGLYFSDFQKSSEHCTALPCWLRQ